MGEKQTIEARGMKEIFDFLGPQIETILIEIAIAACKSAAEKLSEMRDSK